MLLLPFSGRAFRLRPAAALMPSLLRWHMHGMLKYNQHILYGGGIECKRIGRRPFRRAVRNRGGRRNQSWRHSSSMLRRGGAGVSPSLPIWRAATANPMLVSSQRPSACQSGPSSSPASSDAVRETGDEAMAALVVVREIGVAGIRGIAGFRFGPTRKIAV